MRDDSTTILEEEPILVPGKKSKRILSCAADFFLMLFLEMILYSVFALIANNTPIAQEAGNQITALNKEAKASGLRIYNENGSAYSDSELKGIYFDHIAAYDGTGEPTDCLYRYYCVYESESKSKMDVAAYNTEILSLGKEGTLFVSAGEGKPAMLSSSFRANIVEYRKGVRDNADVVNSARALEDFYSSSYKSAWKQFAESAPYSTLLQKYTSAATKQYVFFGCLAIISYIVAGGIFYFAIPFIHGSGKAVGKRVMHLDALENDGSNLKKSSIFLRGTMEFLQGSFAIPFAALFIYGFDGFMLPFAIIGNTVLRLSLFMAFGGIIGIASLLFMLFRKDGASLSELLSGTIVCTSDVALIGAERAKREAARRAKDE